MSPTAADAKGSLGNQPEEVDHISSPSWVTEDFEDPGALIQSVVDGGEWPEVSETIVSVVLENLPEDGWLPYHYTESVADGLVIEEHLSVRLGNEDSLSVDWRFRWANTPPCEVCVANRVSWDNGWLVWTVADPDRGMIIFDADHPELPLSARIWFFPDPIEWPEAAAETNPVLTTSSEAAEATGAAIIDALAARIPIPHH
jgi:hypothetical protein